NMLSILFIWFAHTTAGYMIPNPPGRYNVTLEIGTLTDYTRNTSFAATTTPRELMVSVFQPVTCETTVAVPYMPNKTAEYQGPFLQKQFDISINFAPFFLEARLPVCQSQPNSCSALEDVPILLFDTGYGIPRHYYNVIASAIASEGFVVITMDHPEETNIITYPDGHVIYGPGPSSPTPEEYIQYTTIRMADASFIIDQLSNATAIAELLPQRGPRSFPTDRIAMMGHSLGGVTAVVLAGQDPRVRGAINWDGSIFSPLPPSGLSKPVQYMSSAPDDPTWVEAWPKLTGPKLWLTVANITHMGFSDALMLFQAAGQEDAAVASLLGTIAPSELLHILMVYTNEWMNGVFAGNIGGPLLQGEEPERFPEVSIVTKSNF
ncbi:hypothetical protein BS50DRAFT_656807, partial [Corynespora cassiicola Philippines]